MTALHLDWESKSPVDLKVYGLDRYSAHVETEVMMGAYAFDDGPFQLWDYNDEAEPPAELVEALLDPEVEKWGFNSQFERVMAIRRMGIKTPYKGWRCAMALANLQSFTGNLEAIGRNVGLPLEQQKIKEGDRLLKLFTRPQKITKTNPHLWRNAETDPEDWAWFCEYCVTDGVAERGIVNKLIKFPVPAAEWAMYELDQRINDRGLPVDLTFARHAFEMATRRTRELREEMNDLTGLANANSGPQLLPWLRDRGYPFSDLQKDTISKVIGEHEALIAENFGEPGMGLVDEEAYEVLLLRQNSARTSFSKYQTIAKIVGRDDCCRFVFQYAGAARTARWSGRRIQPHNLPRTPKDLEDIHDKETGELLVSPLTEVTEAIRAGDYELLKVWAKEPIKPLVGTVRSVIRAPEGYEFRICDLASIETRVTAWLSGCERLLNVFATGRDPYIDFGQDLYRKPYEEVTKGERQNSKPAVLGCTYRLGGGELKEGKKTGLWGYAESMGVLLSKEESTLAVTTFRQSYPEVPKAWYALEEACHDCIRTGRPQIPRFKINGREVIMPVRFEMRKPYLMVWLPSGRPLYYHLPRLNKRKMIGKPTEQYPDGAPYEKTQFSYMGQLQGSKKWVRMFSHGGKLIENLVQAIARDVLRDGIRRAAAAGFNIRGHVHDEIITMCRKGDNQFTWEYLRELMMAPMKWAPTLPLDAAGFAADFYKKD